MPKDLDNNQIYFYIYSQDSYALCRVFKKTIQIPNKSNKEEKSKNSTKTEKDLATMATESSLNGIDPISRGIKNGDENFNNNDFYPNKFVSETSSSDLTQGTPNENGVTDDLQAPFASDNEANSAADLYSLGIDCSSNLIEVGTIIIS